jgi:catechol 2,3-dioxygenase-like lactoylglutathione lyase family enzyme
MVDHIQLVKVLHVNALVDGYQDTIDHFRDLFGGELHLEQPAIDEVETALMTIGGTLFEWFAPVSVSHRGQGRLLGRYGDHYLGMEYQVPDLAEARAVVESKGVRILREQPNVFFTHPRDCFGVSWEIFAGDFFAPPDGTAPLLATEFGPNYWSDEHPLGITGLARWSAAVDDLDAATAWYEDFLGASVLYREPRPRAVAKAVGLSAGDTVLELISPTGDGPVQHYLDRYTQHMRATTFAVRSIEQVQEYFATRGITLVDGDAPGARAIPPERNHGLLFEFTE